MAESRDPQARADAQEVVGRDSTESVPVTEPTSTLAGEPDAAQQEAVTAEAQARAGEDQTVDYGVLPVEEVRERFIAKISNGDTSFPEDMLRGMAVALGVEDRLDPAFFGRSETPSPTAGLTPATGSGGVPFKAEEATDETREHAEKLEEVANVDPAKDQEVPNKEMRRADARALRSAVGVS